jgi:hypothetical protein
LKLNISGKTENSQKNLKKFQMAAIFLVVVELCRLMSNCLKVAVLGFFVIKIGSNKALQGLFFLQDVH